MKLSEIIGNPDKRFPYMLLDRMRMDCEYYLGNGRLYGNHLLAGNEAKQIAYMKAIWRSFPADAKPEWLSFEDILTYERRMNVLRSIRDYMDHARTDSGAPLFVCAFSDLPESALLKIEDLCNGSDNAEIVLAAVSAVVGTSPT